MIQALLVVAHPLKNYTVSNVLFHKYVGANVLVKNCMSQFYMFVSTKATKFPRGPTIDVSKFSPGFMLQMDFSFFNV